MTALRKKQCFFVSLYRIGGEKGEKATGKPKKRDEYMYSNLTLHLFEHKRLKIMVDKFKQMFYNKGV